MCVEEGRIDDYAGQDTTQRGAHVFSGAKAVRGEGAEGETKLSQTGFISTYSHKHWTELYFALLS